MLNEADEAREYLLNEQKCVVETMRDGPTPRYTVQ